MTEFRHHVREDVSFLRVVGTGSPRHDESVAENGLLQDMGRTLSDHLSLQFNLCCKLEALADALPNQVDPQECLVIARSIIPVIRKSHAFEEGVLFPALQARFDAQDLMPDTLERLRFEHWEDESFAGELSDSLTCFVTGHASCNVESLSYMLRGFFEGLRRHIAFEREHILPLIQGAV